MKEMLTSESVRVSVIIPVYNGADTVARAIQSVLAQDYSLYELIIVDDGSTDSTADVVRGFGSGIKYIRQENRGPAAARNTGANIAHGEYLAFLDADDQWTPAALGKLSQALDANADAALAFCDFIAVGEQGGEQISTAGDAPSMSDLLARGWPILTSAVLMRRQRFMLSDGFCEEFRKPGFEDPYMWLRIREHGQFIYVSEALMIYSMRPFTDRIRKYEPARRTFNRLVRRRYGQRAKGVLRSTRVTFASALLQEGLRMVDRGEFGGALRAFAAMIRVDPLYLASPGIAVRLLTSRNLLRLFRSRALSSDSRENG